jgi:hypothetical protein
MNSFLRQRTVALSIALVAVASCHATTAAPESVAEGGTTAYQTDSERACNAWYDASRAYTQKLGFSVPPDDARDRFVQNCKLLVEAPGQSGAAAALAKCTDASQPCEAPLGTLAAGTPCGASIQCASGFCKGPAFAFDGLPWPRTRCGVCKDPIPAGAACTPAVGGQPADICAAGSTCVFQGYVNDVPTGKCGTVSPPTTPKGTAGATCHSSNDCVSGLTCHVSNPAMNVQGTCGPPTAAGGKCAWSEDCEQPLICLGTCQSRGAEGASCGRYVDFISTVTGSCSLNMACVPPGCTPFTYAAPGEACSDAVLCTRKFCIQGVCPTVVPNSSSCDDAVGDNHCDAYASCLDKSCEFFDPASCR